MLTTYRIAKTAVSAFFGVGAFVFFGWIYPYHVHYHEQYQIFQYTAEYASQVLSCPGGLADWLSRYAIQYFYQPVLGAAILAVLLTLVQAVGWKLLLNRPLWAYPISFLPAVALWMFLADENAMPGAVVAILLAQLAALGVVFIANAPVRRTLLLAGIPIAYLLCGSLGIAFPLIALIWEWRQPGSAWAKAAITAVAAAVCVACPIVAHAIFPYQWRQLAWGLHYYRFPLIVPALPWLAVALMAVLTAGSRWVSREPRSHARQYVAFGFLIIAVMTVTYYGVGSASDMDKEEALAYDYMVRNKQWAKIIETATAKQPRSPMGVASLNLALGMTGQLADYMFLFYQNGPEGLLPSFDRDFTTPLPTSEAYYHLGMVNTAQRYVFEAQEAVPDFQKSARCYKRLAETNIINGNYEVARKYIEALRHTLVYSQWAENALAMLGNEEAINSHPEYGRLRQMMYKEDFFFNEPDRDSMLGRLYLNSDKQNKLAYEYLLAWCLLSKDLQRFYDCLRLGASAYDRLPISWQEALAIIASENPAAIQPFADKISPALLQQPQGGAYWKYYFK